MGEDRSDLMVFIDLGFILLVGFLILADTTQKENIPLPSSPDDEEQPTPAIIGTAYEVQFDVDMNFLVTDPRERQAICSASGIEEVTPCIVSLADSAAQSVFVLLPRGRAVVQQLVSLLDLCQHHGWRCTVDS